MIRKAALVGCKEGPWVSLMDMGEPEIRAKMPPGTRLRVEHMNGKPMADLLVLRAGSHELRRGAHFARVIVEVGDCETVLCDFISRSARVQA